MIGILVGSAAAIILALSLACCLVINIRGNGKDIILYHNLIEHYFQYLYGSSYNGEVTLET